MSKTQDNLKEAFAGESQANRKYLAFSRKAEKEGLAQMSRLLKAIAEAETIHALKHLDVMGGNKTTLENLKGALEGETHEFEEMYPEMIKQAEAEDNKAARATFHLANEAEKAHAELYKKAIAALEGGGDFPGESFHLCPICGYVAVDHAPDKCPICGNPGKNFEAY
ncbi:MAG: rubrerythrin family protein [Candidatus Saccharibacteria bacterium]